VEYLPLEETDDEIVQRFIAKRTGISTLRLSDGALAPSELRAAEAAVLALRDLPLTVTSLRTNGALDADSLVGLVAASRAALVILDHLQKVITRGESRVYGIEEFLNRLHALAIRRQIVVIVTAQLSRDMDKERRPP